MTSGSTELSQGLEKLRPDHGPLPTGGLCLWKISLCVSNWLECGLSVDRQGPRAWICDFPQHSTGAGTGTGEVKVWHATSRAPGRGERKAP